MGGRRVVQFPSKSGAPCRSPGWLCRFLCSKDLAAWAGSAPLDIMAALSVELRQQQQRGEESRVELLAMDASRGGGCCCGVERCGVERCRVLKTGNSANPVSSWQDWPASWPCRAPGKDSVNHIEGQCPSVLVIKLIRTGTTLDLSQKAEKGMSGRAQPPAPPPPAPWPVGPCLMGCWCRRGLSLRHP